MDNIAKFREFFKTHDRTKTEKWLWKQTQLQVRVDIITSDILANSWLNWKGAIFKKRFTP